MYLSIADSLYRNGAMHGARARVIAATKFREFAGFLGESSSGFGIGARSRAAVPGETFSRSPRKGKPAEACSSTDAGSIGDAQKASRMIINS